MFYGKGSFKDVSRVFHDFQGCFQSVSRKFQKNFQGVSKKFHFAWHSSQLLEQKEGLFAYTLAPDVVQKCFCAPANKSIGFDLSVI